jgi:hypothetical protein
MENDLKEEAITTFAKREYSDLIPIYYFLFSLVEKYPSKFEHAPSDGL